MEQIVSLIQSSTLHQYHQTTLQVLRILEQQNTTSQHFTYLLQCLLSSNSQTTKIIYFYVLEQLLVHNSDNLKKNKLSLLLNLALSQSLDMDVREPQNMMAGLLFIKIHLNNIVRSNVWIPEVWVFIGKCLEVFNSIQIKKYRQKQWGIIFVLDKITHKDILFVFIKILSSLFGDKNLSFLSQKHKDMLISLSTKTQQTLLTPIIQSLSKITIIRLPQLDSSIPFMIKEYTPRILSTQRTQKQNLNLLKKKKNQLKKRVISDLRSSIYDRMQEKQIRDEAKIQRIRKRQKKQLFIIEKQTAQAKKVNRMKKIAKGKGKGGKGK